MKRLLLLVLLAGAVGMGLARTRPAHLPVASCSGCCTTPANCPTPSCCSK